LLSFYLLPAKQSISEEPTANEKELEERMRSSKEEEGLGFTLCTVLDQEVYLDVNKWMKKQLNKAGEPLVRMSE
jgi:hypothetical protein